MKSWMLFLWVTSYQSLSLVPPCWNNWDLTSLMLNFLKKFIKIILFCVSYSMKKTQYLMADNYEISFFINLKKYKSLLKCPKLWQLIRKIATSRDILRKRCSENTQQIYRRTPMPKCDFNKVARQLYWAHFGMGYPVNLLHIFGVSLPKNTSGELLLHLLYSSPNPVDATDLCLYPLKTWENLWLCDIFRGYRKEPVT